MITQLQEANGHLYGLDDKGRVWRLMEGAEGQRERHWFLWAESPDEDERAADTWGWQVWGGWTR